MDSLQAEQIMEILSRVPTPDLLKLRYVCKRWNNILTEPLFRRLHNSHSISKPNENRVIMLKRSSTLYSVDLTDTTSPRQIAIDLPYVPNFSYYSFIGSCNGLLCLGNKKYSQIFVVNPFTRQHVLFPIPLSFDGVYGFWSWGFGFDEAKKLYKVIVVVCRRRSYHNLEARIYDLGRGGSTNWRNISVTSFHVSKSPACFFNGRLHWVGFIDHSVGIVSFDLADEKFRSIQTPDCLSNDIDSDLMVLGGHLCIFHSQDSGTSNLQIWVMKEYGIKASWVKQFDTRPLIPRSLLKRYRGSMFLEGLGFVKDGELVLLKRNIKTGEEAVLFCSDSTCEEFKQLQLERPPYAKGSIIHTASLNWI